ncbi:hypothetical protein CO024_01455, partial [Candidatus Gracilibacteria bacterium CG_4_9_14_0_2_um_filter_38_7]
MLPYIEQNKDLLKYSSFHTPAVARYFFELREHSDIEKLHDIWKAAEEKSLPIVFLGSGTNVVFAFDTFEGIIVRNNLKGTEWRENTVKVSGGELISPLSLRISKAKEKSLFEKWVGLPGTVGGAVAGNAGCFGFEAKDAVLEATIFDMETGEYRTLGNKNLCCNIPSSQKSGISGKMMKFVGKSSTGANRTTCTESEETEDLNTEFAFCRDSSNELDFSYRHSILKDNTDWFLVDAVFRTDLASDDTTDVRTFRSGKQPGGFTCGSFFRNPVGDSAGRLIDQVGLKGYRTGGVKISELHANFFVNDENGSYKDILA